MAKIKNKLVEACNRVWKAWMRWGPVDDGRPEGDEFDEALIAMHAMAKVNGKQTDNERQALVSIVNALDEVTEPCHFKIKEAIEDGRKVLSEWNYIVEEN